ncbi:MAG: SusD/RagB family nutrient-binding outer membrane lipoprotein [Flavobacteriales bacterium]
MNIKLYISFLTLIALTFSACKTDITDLNVNPNDSLESDPELLFKHSIRRGMSSYLTATNLEYNGISHWVMNFAARGGINTNIPYVSPPGGDAFWQEAYVDAMNNAQVIIDREESAGEDFSSLKAVALIWKTYVAHRITDLWGAIPYSQALQGNPELSFAPAYDTQREVYEKMLSDLALALEQIENSSSNIAPESDLLFAGDLQKWKEFANSLRFRLAIRVSDVDENMASEVLIDLATEELFTSNASSAEFQFNSVFNSPLNEAGNIRFFEGEQYVNPSKFLVDLLVESNDPRIKFYLEEANLYNTFDFLDQYKGVPNLLSFNSEEWDDYDLDETLGDPNGEWGDVSRIGEFFMNNERPVPLLSYSELCLLKAEAVLKGLWNGSADDLVKEGIRSHMEHMNFHNYSDHENIEDQDIDDYVSGISGVDLEEVITQKWILLAYENTLESFTELRRTGFPTLVDFYGESIDNSIFPQRLKYPNSESTLNQDNYLEALDMQGPDELSTPLWWSN